jgi:hypothetical protein
VWAPGLIWTLCLCWESNHDRPVRIPFSTRIKLFRLPIVKKYKFRMPKGNWNLITGDVTQEIIGLLVNYELERMSLGLIRIMSNVYLKRARKMARSLGEDYWCCGIRNETSANLCGTVRRLC